MAIAIPNFEFSYRRNDKPIYVPTSIGRRIGQELKIKVGQAYTFDPIYFHLRRGGHVAAIHNHRDHTSFAKLDISRFLYRISRRRVQSALDRIGIGDARFYAKWSTVANPYDDPDFALPYGFVQSPVLATLVLATSQAGLHLLSLPPSITVSIYMDDISLSSNDSLALEDAYASSVNALETDGFSMSAEKLRAPAPSLNLFNCDLSVGRTIVRDDRIAEFVASQPTIEAEDAFVTYCASVEEGNTL